MKIFDRSVKEYWDFTKLFVAALVIVFFARLALGWFGAPAFLTRVVTLEFAGVIYTVYFAIAVETKKFGSYSQLLVIVLIGEMVRHGLIVLAILHTIYSGNVNLYTAPEFSLPGINQWHHLIAHLIGGIGAGTLTGWGVASLILFLWRRIIKTSDVVA